MSKMYKAEFVITVCGFAESCENAKEQAGEWLRNELHENWDLYKPKKTSLIKTVKDVPKTWLNCIPWGDLAFNDPRRDHSIKYILEQKIEA